DPDWIYEFKWDGVRALAYIRSNELRLVSRNEKEMTFRYPELAVLSSRVNAKQAIVDGEIVCLDESGRPSFQLLQSRIGLQNASEIARLARLTPVVYYIFDILYYDRL